MNRVACALAVVVALFSCTPVFAQGATADISGRVVTDTGEILSNASITLTDIDTLVERTTRSDDHGRFAFPAVAAGRYQVTAEHEGFADRRQDDIALGPAQRLQIELPLRRAPLPETIALNPYPPIAESARTHASAFISDTELRDLPVLGQRYLRLAELAPAVSQEDTFGGLSVMNLPAYENRLVIDGFDHTSSLTGQPLGGDGPNRVPYQLSQSAIGEFRIETNGAPAEVGGAAAATFTVVTRSGSNMLRGSAYEFFGDRSLNGRRTIDEKNGRAKPPYRNNQFGATAGGPISRQHNFFFLSYEALRRTATLPREARHQHDLLARSDHDYWGQHLMLRYMDQDYRGWPDDTASPSHLETRSGAASLTSVFTGSIVNEARLQYAISRERADLPFNFYFPYPSDTRRVEVGETLSWAAGGHSLKAGGDLLRDANRIQLFEDPPFARTFPVDDHRYAAFAQDVWRATDALTVDMGVRYDGQDQDMPLRPPVVNRPLQVSAVQNFGTALPPAQGNWAPRAGVAWSPGERKQVFRGTYGLFSGSTPALLAAQVARFSELFISRDFQAPRVHQASVGWEVEKYRAGSLGIDYLFARGERLPRPVNVTLTTLPLKRFYRRIAFQSTAESTYNGVTLHARARVLQQLFSTIAYTVGRSDETPQWSPTTLRDYWQLGLPSEGSLLQTRYPGNNDRHQHLTMSAMYDTSILAVDKHGLSKRLVKDWECSLVYTWFTGTPYAAWVSGDLNGDIDPFNDLAPGTAWNQYRKPYQASFDPRVARRFRVGPTARFSLIWEAFNLTNRPNYTAVDNRLLLLTVPGPTQNPKFGEPTRQLNGRVMQLAARLTF